MDTAFFLQKFAIYFSLEHHISMKKLLLALSSLSLVMITSCTSKADEQKIEVLKEAPEQPTTKVVKTEEEWKKLLTKEQYYVARKAGTERAFNSTYKEFAKQGDGEYYCVGCNAKLFSSKTKFDSGSGWPSFWDIASKDNVATKVDNSHGTTRVEVLCAKCDAHLGHVFEGEPYGNPTNKRYCINGIVLKFVPEKAEAKKEEKEAE